MKKILFDCIALQPSQGMYHGGGEYAKAILYKLIENGYGDRLTCFYIEKLWIDENILMFLNKNRIKVIKLKAHKEIQHLIDSLQYDRLYSALPGKYYKYNLDKIEFYCTIHDFRDLEMPTDKYEFFLTNKIIEKAKFIIKTIFPDFYRKLIIKRTKKLFNPSKQLKSRKTIVDSMHSKYCVKSFISDAKLTNFYFFYPPIKKVLGQNTDIGFLKKIGVEVQNYILIVSGNRWIKNPCRALKALDNIDRDVKVIVTGTKINQYNFLNLKHKERFIFLNYVDDSLLEMLYKNAFFLLYPSLHEGFGYPPLEAMKYGTPVIGSAIASITEVYGDSIIYFNPFAIHEIENRINMFYAEKELREIYQKKSLIQTKKIMKMQTEMTDDLCKLIVK